MVRIIEETPPQFLDIKFEYDGISFPAVICLLDTGKIMISFPVSNNGIEQSICQNLLNSRGKNLNIKLNCIPLTVSVDTCSFTLHSETKIFLDFSIIFLNSLSLRNEGTE